MPDTHSTSIEEGHVTLDLAHAVERFQAILSCVESGEVLNLGIGQVGNEAGHYGIVTIARAIRF